MSGLPLRDLHTRDVTVSTPRATRTMIRFLRTLPLLCLLMITALSVIFLAGCAAPVSHAKIALSTYDKDTEYGIEAREDGFAITVYYSRYQFMPESDALATACKSQLTALAWEHSSKVGRAIEPIDEQRIRISMGRIILTEERKSARGIVRKVRMQIR